METLQLLADMIKDLPDLAIWVILAFFGYKLFMVGSTYFLVRLLITKAHSYLSMKKGIGEIQYVSKPVDNNPIRDLCMSNGVYLSLQSSLLRLRKLDNRHARYLHSSDIDKLDRWIDQERIKEGREIR